jgi:prepilin-type N-terminal cleavage/methylation domain-containing protein/prepilin-type processing-associated H-X9-DG protein
MKTSRFIRSNRRDGFTLLELLVTISVIGVLMGILIPALSTARCEGTKVKCLANLRELGMAFSTYSTDDDKNMSTPVHPKAECTWRYDGEYEYGGATGVDVMGSVDFKAENRILNRYVFTDPNDARMSFYQCPSDKGIQSVPVNFDPWFFIPVAKDKPCYVNTGTSYRLNNQIDFVHGSNQFYGPYLRPTNQIADSSTTVLLEETVTEVAKWNVPSFSTMGWHRKTNIFNVMFADGHAGAIHLAGQTDASADYDGYWILRGENWRMDCYPRPPICDKYSGSGCGSNCPVP